MRTPKILIMALGDSASAQEGLGRIRGACAQWDRDCRPIIEPVEVEEGLFGRSPADIAVDELLVLIVDRSCVPARLGRICDRIEALGLTACALLCDGTRTDAKEVLVSRGVVCEPTHIGPVELSVLLRTLLSARPASIRLTRELARARRNAGGLLGEMHRWREELSEAAGLQRELMPAILPSIPGVETAAMFRPANHVSGDVFDAREIPGGRLAMFVGDAVGHGVPAALLTIVMMLELERAFEAGIDRPEIILERINESLRACQGETPRFATAVCAVLDPATREVVIASAGHPAPLRLRSGEADAIDVGGPLLGVFPGAVFEPVRLTLGIDETLVLYSDGFETAFGDAEEHASGMRRKIDTQAFVQHFKRVLGACDEPTGRPGPLNENVRRLVELIDAQPGSLHQKDDLTILAIGMREPSTVSTERQRIAA